ncbi:hypothetical protein [Sulfurimonas sp.]
MINKKIYTFLFIALLSFVSLNTFAPASFVESTSKSTIESVEQKNNIEREAVDSSNLLFDLDIAIYEVQLDITYKDKIYSLFLSDNPLRPPIFTI